VARATARPTATPTPATEVTRSVAYTNVDDEPKKLDVHVPSQSGPWPVVVVVHRFHLSRFNPEPLARAIASQGAVVFNIDVALSVPVLPTIERLACAIRFARAATPDHGGGPSRVTVVGSSGGAAIGIVVGLARDDFEGDRS
jgi:acetyl esterase/lipase